jgi:CTP:molybdopterin cytidylyltransferase MocA
LPVDWAKTLTDMQVEGGLRVAIRYSGRRITRVTTDDSGVLRNINEPADLPASQREHTS